MKLIGMLFAALFSALSLNAGMTYQFDSRTTGLASANLAGTVKVEGTKMRIDLSSGDNVLFRSGSVLLTKDAGKTLIVADPREKSYYELSLADLGGAGALLGQLGDSVKFSIDNEKMSVRELGDGGTIEGFPTRRREIDSSYDIVIEIMGQKITMTMKSKSELWVTDKLDASLINVFQMRGVKSGIAEIDALLEKQSANLRGFPMKQVTTVTVVQNGQESKTVTTSTVRAVKEVKVLPSELELGKGYTKVASPLAGLSR